MVGWLLGYCSILRGIGTKIATSEEILFRRLCVPGIPTGIVGNDPVISLAKALSADFDQFLLVLCATLNRCSPFSNKEESLKHGVRCQLGVQIE